MPQLHRPHARGCGGDRVHHQIVAALADSALLHGFPKCVWYFCCSTVHALVHQHRFPDDDNRFIQGWRSAHVVPRARLDASGVQADDRSVVGEQLDQHASEKSFGEEYVVIHGENRVRVRKVFRQRISVHHIVTAGADEMNLRWNRRRVCLEIVPDEHDSFHCVSHGGVTFEELQVVITSSRFVSHEYHGHLIFPLKRCVLMRKSNKLAVLLSQTRRAPNARKQSDAT
mmetsp:Transcript_207/g.649  ORF Transcript_207/g.649 Transcript_207/m.649 type:complete len:228 (+) Transcript_207:442-1125(+)